MKKILLQIIKSYQKFISPYNLNKCRYFPSCSQYAVEAIEKRSLLFAVFLISFRLLKCAPWGKGGFDPVPEKNFRRVK